MFLVLAGALSADDGVAQPMFDAVRRRDLAGVAALLDRDSTLASSRDDRRRTPPHYAVSRGATAIAELLIARGADVNAAEFGRPGEHGGLDLWVSVPSRTGGWRPAVNLAPTINSSAADICPQVSPDGRLLFFNSYRNGNADNYWVRADVNDEIRSRPAPAQRRDTLVLSPDRADAVTGLYALEDGRLVHVMDLRDQMRGEPTLSATEYASGRARALFPRPGGRFDAGNAWFRWDSIIYRVRFDETERPAPALTWEEGGRVFTGRRAGLVEREVTIQNGDVRLAGVLVLPPGPGPHPALVLVAGSGPQSRRIRRQVADLLAYHGVAVLVTDKRGTGGSTGTWNGLSHHDWAGDVEAELDFLRTQPDIDRERIGLYGNSESGYVVPVVAARRDDVRFLVCRVCAALPHGEVIPDMETGIRRRQGMEEAGVAAVGEMLHRMIRYALTRSGYDSLSAHFERGAGTPWRASFPLGQLPAEGAAYWDVYRGVLEVDPRDYYARLHIPVLIVLGEADDRLLIGKHRDAFQTLAADGADLDLWVVPEASHGLMLGPNNSLGYPPGLHARLVEWIVRAAGVDGDRG